MAKRKRVSQSSLKTEENTSAAALHIPVLLNEVLNFLEPQSGLFVDATLGMGGHSEAILKA